MTSAAAHIYTFLALDPVWLPSSSLFSSAGLSQGAFDVACDELVTLGAARRETNLGVILYAAQALPSDASDEQITCGEALSRISEAIATLSAVA